MNIDQVVITVWAELPPQWTTPQINVQVWEVLREAFIQGLPDAIGLELFR